MQDMPEEVQDEFGRALLDAQYGEYPDEARPFGEGVSRRVMKLIANHRGDTFRAAYTVEFDRCVYLLHVFKKKSKSGKGTPRAHLATIEARYKTAGEHYARTYRMTEEPADD